MSLNFNKSILLNKLNESKFDPELLKGINKGLEIATKEWSNSIMQATVRIGEEKKSTIDIIQHKENTKSKADKDELTQGKILILI